MKPHPLSRLARGAVLMLGLGAGQLTAAPAAPAVAATAAPAPVPAPAPAPVEPAAAVTAPAVLRDPFELTPQMQTGARPGGLGFVQLLRDGDGQLPPIRLKALIDSPDGRIALVDVQGVGQFRVREGENIQLTPTVGMRVQRIGRDELVLTPADVHAGINQLIIK